MKLTSKAFEQGSSIPATYTCDGKDISPPLEWTNVPEGVKSFALICDDPDAPGGTWLHWVIYDLPGDARGFDEGVLAVETLPNGARQGITDFERVGYGGPCPPSGTHRYFFRLYALDSPLAIDSGAKRAEVERAMKGHIVVECELMGTYKRANR